MANKKNFLEQFGPAAACVFCLIGIAAGGTAIWIWKDFILPQTGDFKWWLTFAGPGELFVGTFTGISLCAVGCLAACVAEEPVGPATEEDITASFR